MKIIVSGATGTVISEAVRTALTSGVIINAADLATAIIEVAKKGSDKPVLYNKEIKRIVASVKI